MAVAGGCAVCRGAKPDPGDQGGPVEAAGSLHPPSGASAADGQHAALAAQQQDLLAGNLAGQEHLPA